MITELIYKYKKLQSTVAYIFKIS